MQGAAQREEAWTEYIVMLKDSPTELKEFVVSVISNQDTLMKEMQEERKQMKSLVVKNTKLMAMLESNISRNKETAATNSPETGR